MRLQTVLKALAITATFGMATTSPAQKLDNNSAWLMANTALVDHLKGLDANILQKYFIQLPSADLDAAWDDSVAGPWSLLEIADSLADWSPVWLGNTGTRFSDAYGDFVTSILLPSRTDVKPAVLKRAEDEWKSSADAANAENLRWERKWKVSGIKSGQKKQDWWRDNAAPHTKPLIEAKNAAFTKYFNLLDPQAATSGKQISKYVNFSEVPFTVPDGSTTENHYPYYASNKALKDVAIAGEAQFQAKKLTKWEFDGSTSYRHDETESWGANAGYGGFIKLGGSGNRHTLDTNGTSVKLVYGFYKLGIIPITPGDWYTGLLIKKFKDGPFKPNSPVSTQTLWGPNGTLRLRAAAIVVAYKPQISAYLSRADYSLVEQTYHEGGSVSIGPFSFGGSHDRHFETETSNKEEGRFSVESVNPNPQVVAILFEKLNPPQ